MITGYFGNTVVAIIKDPVEKRRRALAAEKDRKPSCGFRKIPREMSIDKQSRVNLEATLATDDLKRLAEKLGLKPDQKIEGDFSFIVQALSEKWSMPWRNLWRRLMASGASGRSPFRKALSSTSKPYWVHRCCSPVPGFSTRFTPSSRWACMLTNDDSS